MLRFAARKGGGAVIVDDQRKVVAEIVADEWDKVMAGCSRILRLPIAADAAPAIASRQKVDATVLVPAS